jgi:glycolate dehydrogenase iron-sulfur subunit
VIDRAASFKIAPPDKYLACVHCGLCLSACPTYVETGREADSPRGRIYLMKALEEGRTSLGESIVRHLDLCLGCRACETACPSGVAYGELIEGARSFVAARARRSWRERWTRRALAHWLPEGERLRLLASFLRAAARLGVPRLATARWLPVGLRRLIALTPDAAPRRHMPAVLEPVAPARATVALLTGCVAAALFPRVNELSARLLVAAGYRVRVPRGQTCCGALLAHLGEHADASRRAQRNTNVFLGCGADFVATNAAGCGAMMREYGRLFAGDPRQASAAQALSKRVRDVTELLAAGALPLPQREVRARVAYHDACHLAHGQGVRREPRDLLRSIPGLELLELDDGELCCGSAGTYNLTEPDMARRLGERKAQAVLATGAEIVAAANPGCILQIRAALRLRGRDLRVVHPVELLAEAHGLS